jgi:carboxyl-terminal processing protease
VALALACLAAAGVLAGVVFLNTGQASERTVYTQLKVLTEVLGLITDNYVERVNGEDLVDGAITGMLGQLDPHSNYLDPERYKRMQERNRGLYYGIGVSFEIVAGDLTVVSAIEGSPSAKLGIRPGDIIVKIDGSNAKGIKQEEVFDRLRGERGTIVHVTIRRPGETELLEFDIVRDEIPIYSVPYSFMLRPDIGYIRMIRFASTTSDELERALQKLEAQGMERLILDIRGNAGGYLNEAIEVADKFLPGGRKLVYPGQAPDRGVLRPGAGKDRLSIDRHDRPLSEAHPDVPGAVQDWDRALIVQRSCKGAIQPRSPMNEGALISLLPLLHPSGG